MLITEIDQSANAILINDRNEIYLPQGCPTRGPHAAQHCNKCGPT